MYARDRMRNRLPFYNDALGAAQSTLVVPPPFSYPGVTARIFPLRASLNILSSFCQRYLNVAPEICQFRPFFPYVLLVVLDYGRMALEDANLGWVSQHEIFFEVPLGMWKPDPRDPFGRLTFRKWVVNTPFIVVDNPASLTTGRETYGWPKVLADLKYSPESWLIDPRNPIRFLTLDVKGISFNEPDTRLLEIEQRLHQNIPLAPPDLSLIDPFGPLSQLTRAGYKVGFDLAQLLLGSPLAGFGRWNPGDRFRILFDGIRRLFAFLGGPDLDVVTLKQFRDARSPTQICYQALVESRLGIDRFNHGGFLGLYNLLQGDISGGFSIRLHENPAFPIVESLGLDVVKTQSSDGHNVWVLEPYFPFWMSVDLTYSKGKTVCWRRLDTPWHVKDKPIPHAKRSKTAYNTVAGAAAQVWYGPFFIPNAAFDIFPLKADKDTLRRFVYRYLEQPSGIPFELWGEHVYMVASSNRIFSSARAAAWIDSREISFYVPIWWDSPDKTRFAMATPFAFVDNPTLAMTLREVQGVPAMAATMEAPSRFWKREGPRLTMSVDVFTALDAGLRGERQTLLEVSYPPAPLEPLLELDDNGEPDELPLGFERLMLKQFRDAEVPQRACYQGLIVEPWTFSNLRRILFFPAATKINIHRYPSLPLVDTLGLLASRVMAPQDPGGAIIDVFEPEDPFRIELSLKIGLGRVLSHAAGHLPWTTAADTDSHSWDWFVPLLTEFEEGKDFDVATMLRHFASTHQISGKK